MFLEAVNVLALFKKLSTRPVWPNGLGAVLGTERSPPDSQAAHRPGLRAPSPAGACRTQTTHVSLSLRLPLSLESNQHKNKTYKIKIKNGHSQD